MGRDKAEAKKEQNTKEKKSRNLGKKNYLRSLILEDAVEMSPGNRSSPTFHFQDRVIWDVLPFLVSSLYCSVF